MADWDSILMSESFTFSLFALQLAVLTNLVFRIYRDPDSNNSILTIIWAILFFAWTFLRDTNLFASLVTIGMIGFLFLSARYRKVRCLYWILALSLGILTLGFITSSTSTRSLIQMANIYKDDLLSSPARVTALEELGMPAPDSADYPAWFKQSASKTLIKFMFLHPGYPLQKIIRDFPSAFTEIKQTYFKAPAYAETRKLLMRIGNALHPESATPFLMDLLLMVGLLLLASRNTSGTIHPWAWLGLWLMLTASITIIPTILGDTWAINRHSLFSTTVYRLFMWIFSLVIMDIALEQNVINMKSR
jgi:hypothetical protein